MPARAPFFIIGCPRSGTSLLTRILNSHSSMCVPYETHLYRTFWPWRHFYRDLSSTAAKRALISDFASTWAAFGQSLDIEDAVDRVSGDGFHAVVSGIMSSLSASERKSRWGEKTPDHIFCFDAIREGFPSASFIHVIRDGRDCALSWKRARFGPKHLYVAGERWRSYISAIAEIEKKLPSDQFLEVRYEALLREPRTTVQQICEFLGEPFEAQMLEYHRNKVEYPTDRSNQRNLNKPLMNDNFNKWKRELSAREIEDIEAGAAETLTALGYDLYGGGQPIAPLRRYFIHHVQHPFLRFSSMIRNREGHRFAVNKALVYLRLKTRFLLARV